MNKQELESALEKVVRENEALRNGSKDAICDIVPIGTLPDGAVFSEVNSTSAMRFVITGRRPNDGGILYKRHPAATGVDFLYPVTYYVQKQKLCLDSKIG